MTDQQFKLKDLSKAQCLQKDNKVYWEISFQQPNKTTICCGKLLVNQKKDNMCAKSLERTHKTIKDIIKYIEEQVNNKLSKGYQKLEVELILEQTPVSPEIFNELGKRAKSGGNSSDIENIEPYKKRHLNEKDENKQTIENIQKSLKALQRDRASSQKSSVSKQFLTVPGSETFDSKDDKKGKVSERKLSNTGVSNTQQPYTFIKEYGSPVKALSDGGDDDMEEETIPSSSKKEDVASRKEEFEKRVALLSETNMPFGKPIFEGFNALCRYSTWVDEDLTGWYFSNKLGGIRCVWNGLEMWSKNGTKHDIPDYFIEELPNSPLEGELWTHKGNFTACMSIVKKPKSDLAWNDLGFKVLDAPTLEEPFEERLQKLKKYFEHPEKSNVYVSLENYKICAGKNDAISQLENVEATGGEGIIFRNPKSLHGKGKTSAVLEARSRFEAKAVVEEIITAKKGKNVGDLGSIRVKNVADGTEFLINRGISDEVRKNPPQVKDVILYKFSGKLDSNKPKAPIFVKVISDN